MDKAGVLSIEPVGLAGAALRLSRRHLCGRHLGDGAPVLQVLPAVEGGGEHAYGELGVQQNYEPKE